MKLTEEKFREIIKTSLLKMLMENNELEIIEPEPVQNPIEEQVAVEETINTETLKEDDFDKIEASSEQTVVQPAICDHVSDKFYTTPSEVKKLNEEFKRMKQLVDFRSPLLIKD